MSRQDANAAFALSSFLQGTNAAYIDDLYARYEQDPGSVDAEWQEFFKSLKDTPADVKKNAEGASWGRDNWPLTPRDELRRNFCVRSRSSVPTKRSGNGWPAISAPSLGSVPKSSRTTVRLRPRRFRPGAAFSRRSPTAVRLCS